MVVHANVKIPGFPLFGLKGPLALLEPRILENFEHGEEYGDTAEAICFGRAMPVFGDRDEGVHLIGIRRLRTEESDQRLGKGINYYRPLGSRILPNLRGEIEQRRNHANRGKQLRDRTDRFQIHSRGLTNALDNDDVDLLFCSGGL